MRLTRAFRHVATMAALAGCGSTSGPAANLISVGGSYQTAVTLAQNSCTGITVQPNPTTVAHAPGSTALSLTHAGNTYSGAVAAGGGFTTTPFTVIGGAQTSTITIAGQFSTTGFSADVTVDVQQTPPPTTCRYVVHWDGAKSGAPNTIP